MNVYEVITSRIIQQLEHGTVPWHKPWRTPGPESLPKNLVSGHQYSGVNFWLLHSSPFCSNYWLTFRQVKELGGYVEQGQHGYPIIYWKFNKQQQQDGEQLIEKKSVLCRYYTVFNVDQCSGLRIEPAQIGDAQPTTKQPLSLCEKIVEGWKDKPHIQFGCKYASYRSALDLVQMPDISHFDTSEEFYGTLFHELVHSTGHWKRLKRTTLTQFERFGDEKYSREELIAEMGASFLSGYCGILEKTISNNAAYVSNWLAALKGDSRMVMIAAGQAQKACDMILGKMNNSDSLPDVENAPVTED